MLRSMVMLHKEHQANMEAASWGMEGEGGGGTSVWGQEGAVVAEKGNLLTRVRQFILSHYNWLVRFLSFLTYLLSCKNRGQHRACFPLIQRIVLGRPQQTTAISRTFISAPLSPTSPAASQLTSRQSAAQTPHLQPKLQWEALGGNVSLFIPGLNSKGFLSFQSGDSEQSVFFIPIYWSDSVFALFFFFLGLLALMIGTTKTCLPSRPRTSGSLLALCSAMYSHIWLCTLATLQLMYFTERSHLQTWSEYSLKKTSHW